MPHTQKDLYKKLLGGRGERSAEKFLKKQGFKLLCRNYTTPFGEVDLVMRDKETLVFIEVKTRTGVNFGTPSQAVDQKKRERYVKAAAFYLKHKGIVIDSVAVRFDVVEVYTGDLPVAVSVGSEGDILPRKKHAKITVRHIPAAFM